MAEPLWQSIIVWLCVVIAVWSLIRRGLALLRPQAGDSACGGCNGCGTSEPTNLVTLDLPNHSEPGTSRVRR